MQIILINNKVLTMDFIQIPPCSYQMTILGLVYFTLPQKLIQVEY